MHPCLAVASLALLTACGPVTAAPAPQSAEGPDGVSRSFSLSSSADDEILTLTYRGGMVAARVEFHLFGDGTLRITESDPGGDHAVWKRLQTQVGIEEVARRIRSLVEAGVLEFDWGTKAREIRARGGVVPVIADAPTTKASIALESYSGPSNPAGGPFSHTVAVHALATAARRHPDVPELVALAATARWLTEVYLAIRSDGASR